MRPLIDPRCGDVEDDASSTKQRSLFTIAGSLLAEISLPKLIVAWLLLVVLPGVLVGLAPLVASGWFAALSSRIASPFGSLWPLLVLLFVVGLGWFAGRPLFRAVERGFWSLNSLAVQPGYALCREALRHLAELSLGGRVDVGVLRAASSAGAGIILCGIALLFVWLAWPHSRWLGNAADLASPLLLVVPALANTVLFIGGYLAVASLVWGIADATMDQPRDLADFDNAGQGPSWRIAHLSDIHIVGERYGFRIESGRSGPRGNDKLDRAFARLDDIHRRDPLDIVLISGDVTDAGRSGEWAEFFAILDRYPDLAKLTLILPGNHDLNIVDRANPARLDLPISPGKRLRQMRALSAMDAVQGNRVRVLDLPTEKLGEALSLALQRHRADIKAFADNGTLRLSFRLEQVWGNMFPMVLPPVAPEGLGVIMLNSNAEAHFSFTNALGMVSAEQARAVSAIAREFPKALWIIALHHHLVEYPAPAKAFSERIGTALINGSWFVRQLQSFGGRAVVMHGHRHIDWIGKCGDLRIVSAPSPVMEATNDKTTCFYIHTLSSGADDRLLLRKPEKIEIPGVAES